jgi:hypothetical protein
LIALEHDINGVLMGSRGNIAEWTKIFIKNMKNSYYMQNIYGVVLEAFSWWSLQSEWIVSEEDMDILSGKLLATLYKEKMNIVNAHFKLSDSMVLNFDSLISTEVKDVQIHNQPGEETPLLKWSIVARFTFRYIKKSDLLDVVDVYVKQRLYDTMKISEIDSSSVVFFKDIKKESDTVFIIPTKVDIRQYYDFNKDINHVLSDFKDRIVGLSQEKTRDILFSYPEISSFDITIRPPWYTTVSKLKSRIKISINGKLIK